MLNKRIGMGNVLRIPRKEPVGGYEVPITIVGLDRAGKTSILYKLKLGECVKSSFPTVGFNMESVEYNNFTFNVSDLGDYGDNITTAPKLLSL